MLWRIIPSVVSLLLAQLAEPSPKVYWTTHTEGEIRRADLDGSNVEVVLAYSYDVDSGIESGPILPHALALDTIHEHIY